MREADPCLRGSSTISIGLVAIAALVLSTACGDAMSTDDLDSIQKLPTNTAEQAIKGGEVDNEHTAIVGMILERGGGAGICSGTLIGKNVVLTARHCVSSLSSSRGIRCGQTTFTGTYPASSISVTTETNLRRATNYMGVSEIYVSPDGNGVCGNDIALLKLDTTVPSSTAEPRRPRIRNRVTQNTTYTAIGYGVTDQRTGSGSGTRRSLGNRSVRCVGSNCYGNQVAESEFVGSGGTCQGDSGGGALDEQGRVLGALSRGGGNCDSSLYSGVYKWKDWIKQTTSKAANSAGVAPPDWADPGPDSDGDGISDKYDNCPQAKNKDQTDTDDDGKGDACDSDSDDDGVPDSEDNCPQTINPNQGDADDDGKGNACDEDSDNDGIDDGFDNCPTTHNPDQTISNANGKGDACDPDDDGDGIKDKNDNCPKTENPDQKDSDGDGLGDACDDKPGEGGVNDKDADTIKDGEDNCPNTKNRDQKDSDGDGIGNACDDNPKCDTDEDKDCDQVMNKNDNCPNTKNAEQTDSNDDGTGDACTGGSGDGSDGEEEVVVLGNQSGSGHACGSSATGSPKPADLGGLMFVLVALGLMRVRRRD